MSGWSQIDKDRLSQTRMAYWRDHPERLAAHREKIRASWVQRRAVDDRQCKPASTGLDAQLRARGVTVIEPRIQKLDLWPRSYKELTEKEGFG